MCCIPSCSLCFFHPITTLIYLHSAYNHRTRHKEECCKFHCMGTFTIRWRHKKNILVHTSQVGVAEDLRTSFPESPITREMPQAHLIRLSTYNPVAFKNILLMYRGRGRRGNHLPTTRCGA